MSVSRSLARDRELREHATAPPWHQSGEGPRAMLVGPLPRETVVVHPYGPNPQDAPLLLHRVNTYEELEREIERLRAALRDARERIDAAKADASGLPGERIIATLANDLEARMHAVLGDRRVGVERASATRDKAG